MRAFLRNRGAAAGLVLLVLVGVLAALAPVLFPGSPWDMAGAPFSPPGEDGFLLGSDSLGGTWAAGIAYGASVSLLVGRCRRWRRWCSGWRWGQSRGRLGGGWTTR